MECMCAQTRPRFMLSSERVLGNGVRTHGNSKGKSPLKISIPVSALPGARRYRVSAETGWPGVSIVCLDEIASLICNFKC